MKVAVATEVGPSLAREAADRVEFALDIVPCTTVDIVEFSKLQRFGQGVNESEALISRPFGFAGSDTHRCGGIVFLSLATEHDRMVPHHTCKQNAVIGHYRFPIIGQATKVIRRPGDIGS